MSAAGAATLPHLDTSKHRCAIGADAFFSWPGGLVCSPALLCGGGFLQRKSRSMSPRLVPSPDFSPSALLRPPICAPYRAVLASLLNILSSMPSSSFAPRGPVLRHLDALATNTCEKSGLADERRERCGPHDQLRRDEIGLPIRSRPDNPLPSHVWRGYPPSAQLKLLHACTALNLGR